MNFDVDNTQGLGYRMNHDHQARQQLDDPRSRQDRPQGAPSAHQGVQGQARQAGPQGVEEGSLVKTFDSREPAPARVVAQINAVLDGEVFDYELAFYSCPSASL